MFQQCAATVMSMMSVFAPTGTDVQCLNHEQMITVQSEIWADDADVQADLADGKIDRFIGWYDGDTNTITVLDSLERGHLEAVLIHEAAHAYDLARGTEEYGEPTFWSTRNGVDHEAYAVGVTVWAGWWRDDKPMSSYYSPWLVDALVRGDAMPDHFQRENVKPGWWLDSSLV